MKLLSIGSDSKTVKGEKLGYVTAITYLAPHTVASSRSVCPFATVDCSKDCLYTAGRGSFESVKKSRVAKTLFWHGNKAGFLAQLEMEISAFIRQAEKKGMRPAVRLNGTSDIRWEETGIFEKFPGLQFYDYTKYPPGLRRNLPANYHLTYSFTGLPMSAEWAAAWLKRGANTAVVFRGGLPNEFLGRPVIDGDLSDLRFLDPAGSIVGLKAKGIARKDVSPFVVDVVNGQAVWPALKAAAAEEKPAELSADQLRAIADWDQSFPLLTSV